MPLTADRVVGLMVSRAAQNKLIARVVYTGPVPAPVQQGQPIGTLKVWRSDVLVLEVPLQAAESVGTGNLSQRAFDAATELDDRPVPCRHPAAVILLPPVLRSIEAGTRL